jgi:hypothetical protein
MESRLLLMGDALEEALDEARDAARVLQGHAAEGPYDALDLARMLQVVSRLETVAGRAAEAAAALDEAVSVLAPVARRGPRFADSSSLPGARAFLRAARDLGDETGDTFPHDLAAAAAAAEPPGQHGPRRGLAMACTPGCWWPPAGRPRPATSALRRSGS